jgi:cyclophilin family peptidyl-prolyl cis-trans isomerase
VLLRPVLQCTDPGAAATTIPASGDATGQAVLGQRTGGSCLVGPAAADGSVFAHDAAATLGSGDSWVVTVSFADAAATATWNALASTCYQGAATCPSRQLAIVVDDVIISAPTVNEPTFTGQVQISAGFTQAQAEGLAKLLDGDPTASIPASPATVAPSAPPATQLTPSTQSGGAGTAGFGTAPCPAADGSTPRATTFPGAPSKCIDTARTYTATVTTNHGTFTITLDTAHSPITVNNFVTLARFHYYDTTGCHRVIAGFVVQCGRPGTDETAPGYTIPDELSTAGTYAEGVVAMANTGAADSGGGQWFIITGPDGASLPPRYSVVGRVTDGYDTTVKALAALADPTASNGVPPKSPITITSIVIHES